MARPRGFDERDVLDAAMRQFRRTGYAGTTLDDISAATGLGRGSLYASFDGKHPLFIRTLEHYARQMLAANERDLMGPDDTAADRLRAFLHRGARFVVNDNERAGCMAGQFAHEIGVRDERAEQVIRSVFTEQQRLLAVCVEGAQRHGDLDPSADPVTIGCLLLSVNRGFDVMAKGGISGELLSAAADQAFNGLPLTDQYRTRR